jgi:lipopolysaccharide biosynthesis glycosyltransferase
MENNKAIHIALAFDRNYISPFYVLLTSIFINNKDCNFNFYIIAGGLKEDELKNISEFIKKHNCIVSFYEVDDTQISNLVMPEKSHFSPSTYYRLFFPSLVPEEIAKLLYIDTDIVVINSLSELYNTEVLLPIAAALDPKDEVRPELGIFEKGKYFNSGVLLINLKEWKKANVLEKTINYLNEYPEKIKFVDQDALNAVLIDKWEKLPSKYNVTFYDIPEHIQKKQINGFLKDKIIIHYSTQNKPWLLTCTNRLRFLYNYYLKLSPFPNTPNYTGNPKKPYWRLVKRSLKELLIDYTNYFGKSSK